MSLTALKQNATILNEVAQNYDNLAKTKTKENAKEVDLRLSRLKNQILYLLASIDKLVKEEKNAR